MQQELSDLNSFLDPVAQKSIENHLKERDDYFCRLFGPFTKWVEKIDAEKEFRVEHQVNGVRFCLQCDLDLYESQAEGRNIEDQAALKEKFPRAKIECSFENLAVFVTGTLMGKKNKLFEVPYPLFVLSDCHKLALKGFVVNSMDTLRKQKPQQLGLK